MKGIGTERTSQQGRIPRIHLSDPWDGHPGRSPTSGFGTTTTTAGIAAAQSQQQTERSVFRIAIIPIMGTKLAASRTPEEDGATGCRRRRAHRGNEEEKETAVRSNVGIVAAIGTMAEHSSGERSLLLDVFMIESAGRISHTTGPALCGPRQVPTFPNFSDAFATTSIRQINIWSCRESSTMAPGR